MGGFVMFAEGESFNQRLAADPTFQVGGFVVGTVLGILGLATGYLFYLWGRKTSSLATALTGLISSRDCTTRLLALRSTSPATLTPIPNLTVTKVLFWNAGRETIRKQDVVKTDPVVIACNKPGCEILQADIIQANEPANKFEEKVSQDRQQVTVTFDYVDHGQGAVIQVCHTGTSDKDIEVRGKIMGAGPIRRTTYLPSWRTERNRAMLIALGGLALAASLVSLNETLHTEILLWIPIITLLGTIVGMLTMPRRRGRIPQGFAKFEE